jgi:hypothetical protein
MSRPAKKLRYEVTGPGLDPLPTYDDAGPALSRSLTAAERSEAEGTWYVRDAISGETVGYSERILVEGLLVTTTTRRGKR